MSSTWSKKVPFVTMDYDDRGYEAGTTEKVGRIQVHHTSDTVTWTVDGKDRFIMSMEEWGALLEAIRSLE